MLHDQSLRVRLTPRVANINLGRRIRSFDRTETTNRISLASLGKRRIDRRNTRTQLRHGVSYTDRATTRPGRWKACTRYSSTAERGASKTDVKESPASDHESITLTDALSNDNGGSVAATVILLMQPLTRTMPRYLSIARGRRIDPTTYDALRGLRLLREAVFRMTAATGRDGTCRPRVVHATTPVGLERCN